MLPIVLCNFQFFIQSNTVLFSILSLPLMVQPWVVCYSFCLFCLEESHFFFAVTPTFRWILNAYSSNGPQCAFAWLSPCSNPCHASLAEGFPKQCVHIQHLCPAMLNVDDMVGVFKFLHCSFFFYPFCTDTILTDDSCSKASAMMRANWWFFRSFHAYMPHSTGNIFLPHLPVYLLVVWTHGFFVIFHALL